MLVILAYTLSPGPVDQVRVRRLRHHVEGTALQSTARTDERHIEQDAEKAIARGGTDSGVGRRAVDGRAA